MPKNNDSPVERQEKKGSGLQVLQISKPFLHILNAGGYSDGSCIQEVTVFPFCCLKAELKVL